MPPSATPAAPPPPPSLAGAAVRRQEACALSCLASTDPGQCTALDAACLCASDAWGQSVLSCIQSSCEAETSLDAAYSQLLVYCNAANTPFTLAEPAYTGTMSAEPAAATSAAAAASSSAVALTSKPVNVSAIMAGICSFLFVVALMIGYLGVKEKLARARDATTQRPNSGTGGKRAPGRKASGAVATKDGKRPSTRAAPQGASVGAHSSLFGGATSDFDSAGYAHMELDDRRAEARAARLKEAQRQHNLDTLFTSANASSSSSIKTASSVKVPAGSADPASDSDDDAQYVTLPALSRNDPERVLHEGLPTGSTIAGGGGGLASAEVEGLGTSMPAAGESIVALNADGSPTRAAH